MLKTITIALTTAALPGGTPEPDHVFVYVKNGEGYTIADQSVPLTEPIQATFNLPAGEYTAHSVCRDVANNSIGAVVTQAFSVVPDVQRQVVGGVSVG